MHVSTVCSESAGTASDSPGQPQRAAGAQLHSDEPRKLSSFFQSSSRPGESRGEEQLEESCYGQLARDCREERQRCRGGAFSQKQCGLEFSYSGNFEAES